MIRVTEMHTLELTCDECGKEDSWVNESYHEKYNSYFGARGNKVCATKRDGWSIVRYSCRCPKCKGKPRKK